MSITFTPGQFRRRADFYYQLAQLTVAGLGLVQSLEQLERNPPGASYRRPIGQLLDSLRQGETLADALRRTPGWLPSLDVALLGAGEHSGRLDAAFRLLAEYYADRARLARQVIADLAYPVFLLHFAVFIRPFPQLFLTGNWAVYLQQTLGVLLPLYIVVFAGIYAVQSRHGESWRSFLEMLFAWVPVLGRARRSLALARLCAALEALLSAGVTIIEAWELAVVASASPALTRTVRGWRSDLENGRTPAEMVRESNRFPDLFSSQYAAGEISGKLDETLRRLQQYYQEEGTHHLQTLAQWVPRAIYLVIVLAIAYQILTFWMGHFGQIGDAGSLMP